MQAVNALILLIGIFGFSQTPQEITPPSLDDKDLPV